METKEFNDMLQKRKVKYKKLNADNPTYGNKDSLMVVVTQYIKKDIESIRRYPKKARAKLFRYDFRQLPGTIQIPLSECYTNQDMAEYVSNFLGTGIFNIKSGWAATGTKRVRWRGLLTIGVEEHQDGSKHCWIIKSWEGRLKNYFWRKK